MARFEIGQRVRVKAGADGHDVIGDRVGQVIFYAGDDVSYVEFASAFLGGHDANGRGAAGRCWLCHDSELYPAGTPTPSSSTIGDKVTINSHDSDFDGETGTIEAVDGGGYLVVFPDETWGWFDASEFRAAEPDGRDEPDDDTRIEISVTVKIPPSVLMDFLR